MPGVLLDTSVYVNAFRSGNLDVFSDRTMPVNQDGERLPVWLSAVVLEELLAGANLPKVRKLLKELENDFTGVNRFLVPSGRDWVKTGSLVNKIGLKYSFEDLGRSRLTNDALIAASAARNGLTVLTGNPKDFSRIAEFMSFSLRFT
ncbi:MAG TPA: type II toxin-antitoxin system VapC family toxin [Pyrinomonadaceae bacterium]|nr:type II toxin-antitoxin system VapC family toxin [Pyrinomonadaceae bacterium]